MESADLPPEANNQTNIHGDLNSGGGFVNTGTINTGGAPVIGRDQIIIQQRLDPADLRNQRNHAVLVDLGDVVAESPILLTRKISILALSSKYVIPSLSSLCVLIRFDFSLLGLTCHECTTAINR